MAEEMGAGVQKIYDYLLKLMLKNWRKTGVAYFAKSDLRWSSRTPKPDKTTLTQAMLRLYVRKAIVVDTNELIYAVRPARFEQFAAQHLSGQTSPSVSLNYRWYSDSATDPVENELRVREEIENGVVYLMVPGPFPFDLGAFKGVMAPGTKIVITVTGLVVIAVVLLSYFL